MHPKLVAVAAGAAAAILCVSLAAPGHGQTVSPAAYAKFMQSDIAKRYRETGNAKALALCIDWSKSDADNLVWLALGFAKEDPEATDRARSNALQACSNSMLAQNVSGCYCQIVDVNGQQSN